MRRNDDFMDDMDEFQVPEGALERIQDPKLFKQQIDEGKTFQEILGYTDAVMEKFYQAAYGYFQQQKYEKASEAFTFLTTLNPTVFNYWLGLGMADQMCEEYHSALLAYAMASMVDVTNPIVHYHSASCHRSLLDDESALSSLDLCVLSAGEREEFEDIKTLALKAHKRIRNR
jgi:type III secretion system low calcium response chaperone LcrH/SycD